MLQQSRQEPTTGEASKVNLVSRFPNFEFSNFSIMGQGIFICTRIRICIGIGIGIGIGVGVGVGVGIGFGFGLGFGNLQQNVRRPSRGTSRISCRPTSKHFPLNEIKTKNGHTYIHSKTLRLIINTYTVHLLQLCGIVCSLLFRLLFDLISLCAAGRGARPIELKDGLREHDYVYAHPASRPQQSW